MTARILLLISLTVPLLYSSAQSTNATDATQSASGSEKQPDADNGVATNPKGGGIAGNNANPGAFRVGWGVKPPRALSTPDPDYPAAARAAGYEGTVVLWMVIDTEGKAKQVKVSRSLGMGLDQAAIAAVEKWRFAPATKDGQPVPVQINVEVNFRLGATPPELPLHPSSATKAGHLEFPGADPNQYPLVVHVTDVVPLPKGKHYEVRATAEVEDSASGKKSLQISCESNARYCSTIWSGYYPARWVEQYERLEIVGQQGNSNRWQKAQYSAQSSTPQP